jgi:epsilon-lactone hydrolase
MPSVLVSRVKRGPLRPSWSFGFELLTCAMRGVSAEVSGWSFADQRKAFDAMANQRSPIFKHVTRNETSANGVPAEWFEPKDPPEPAESVVLYFHGGAFIFGSTTSHGELIARIAYATHARVLAPNYRLAPEHPFPAAIDDGVKAYEHLLESGIDPKRIVVSGDSAGGGLAVALLLRLRDAGRPLPAGAALICPWVEHRASGGSIVTNEAFDWGTGARGDHWSETYLAGHDPKDPLASPVHADLSGLPPMLVQVGGAEILLDQATALAERAKASGTDARLVVEPDMVHDWHSFAGIFPHCGRAIDDIGAFVREVSETRPRR